MRRLAGVLAAVAVAICWFALPAQAAFPGENGKIAFGPIALSSPGGHSIWAMEPDGTDLRLLIESSGSDSSPVWSPDGSKIAFASDRDGNAEIYVANADGTGQTRLTTHPDADFGPTWSPDGAKIAFLSSRGGTPDIWVMNADGTGQIALTSSAEAELDPAWSPNGTKLAFVVSTFDDACAEDDIGDVIVIDADGTNRQNLTNTSVCGSEIYPAWSPDGGTIAYIDAFGWEVGGFTKLMNADGTNKRSVPGSPRGSERDPAWSPDGSKIVVADDGTGELVVIDVATGGRQPITDPLASRTHPYDPDWQPIPRPQPPPPSEHKNPAKQCKAERAAGSSAFDRLYRNLGACVSERAKGRDR